VISQRQNMLHVISSLHCLHDAMHMLTGILFLYPMLTYCADYASGRVVWYAAHVTFQYLIHDRVGQTECVTLAAGELPEEAGAPCTLRAWTLSSVLRVASADCPGGCAGGRVCMGPHLKLHQDLKGAAGMAQLSMAAHLHNAALAHHCTHADRRRAVNMQSEVHDSHSVLPCTCNGISVDNGAEAMRDDDGRAVLQDGNAQSYPRQAWPHGWTQANICQLVNCNDTGTAWSAFRTLQGRQEHTLTFARRSSAC